MLAVRERAVGVENTSPFVKINASYCTSYDRLKVKTLRA